MPHVNIQLSDAIGAALTAGGLDDVLVRPTSRLSGKCLVVASGFTAVTTDGRGQGGPGLQTRVITIPVTAVDVADEDVEAALYERAVGIERAIFAKGALDAIKIVGIELGGDSGVSLVQATENGELAGLTLNFNITVRTAAGAPDTSLTKG